MAVRNLGKTIAISAVALLATAIFCAFAFVQFQQHLLRWRAERLLADIHSIQMGKSNWQDAQRLITRWGRWGAWQGECSPRRCDYQIVMEDAFHVIPIYQMPNLEIREEGNQRFAFLRRPYYWLGGRFAWVDARIQVRNGIIWTKTFDVGIHESSNIPFENDDDYALSGSGWAYTNYRNNDLLPGREYDVIHPPCSGCKSLDVEYTPLADPAMVNRLLDFRLSCLTSIVKCRQPSQLMPSAWTVYNQMNKEDAARPAVNNHDDDNFIEKSATDARYAALATIISIQPATTEGKPALRMTFRITQSAKGSVPTGLEFSQAYSLRPPAEEMIGGTHFGDLKLGARTIALFDIRPDQPEPDNGKNGNYFVIPYSGPILAAVQRGIARDKLADVP